MAQLFCSQFDVSQVSGHEFFLVSRVALGTSSGGFVSRFQSVHLCLAEFIHSGEVIFVEGVLEFSFHSIPVDEHGKW